MSGNARRHPFTTYSLAGHVAAQLDRGIWRVVVQLDDVQGEASDTRRDRAASTAIARALAAHDDRHAGRFVGGRWEVTTP